MTQKKGNWRDICEAVQRETDSGRLWDLVRALINALDEESGEKAKTKEPRLSAE